MFTTFDIQPVILCGGSGTRLWPVSRKSYPKQFCELDGETSLFQKTVERLARFAPRRPIAITNEEYRFIVAEQFLGAGDRIILEPDARNTAPAICLAALQVQQTNPDALILVVPSDHEIRNEDAFSIAVGNGAIAAMQGEIVTFGIEPTHPSTEYGYIATIRSDEACRPIDRFVEKPSKDIAEKMLAEGGYLWNSGMFLMRADAVLSALSEHAPDVLAACQRAFDGSQTDIDFLRPDTEAFLDCPSISFDYAVMEPAGGRVVPVDLGWSDLGAWDAIWRESDTDECGVVVQGDSLAVDCQDTLLKSHAEGMQLVGIGLDNIVAVATKDAVLIADKSCAGQVGAVVKQLETEAVPQAQESPRTHRPWGWYESVAMGARFQVKHIMVAPGAQLSLQSHVHRAEHWVVVSGTARVTVATDVRDLSENQSVYVPLGSVHRLENPGKIELHLIEVQSGAYLGEDDIVRYEDIYNRIAPIAA